MSNEQRAAQESAKSEASCPKTVGASRTARAPNQWEHRERQGPMSGKTVGVVLTQSRNKVDAKYDQRVRIMDTRKGINREGVLVAARFSGPE